MGHVTIVAAVPIDDEQRRRIAGSASSAARRPPLAPSVRDGRRGAADAHAPDPVERPRAQRRPRRPLGPGRGGHHGRRCWPPPAPSTTARPPWRSNRSGAPHDRPPPPSAGGGSQGRCPPWPASTPPPPAAPSAAPPSSSAPTATCSPPSRWSRAPSALTVQLYDGTTLPAKLLGVDPTSDVAVVAGRPQTQCTTAVLTDEDDVAARRAGHRRRLHGRPADGARRERRPDQRPRPAGRGRATAPSWPT